jgi:hypothetical protein
MRNGRKVLGAMLLAAAGCTAGAAFLLGERKPPREIPFTHRTHVVAQEIPCEFCHETAQTEAAAGMPAKEVCLTCHEAPEETAKDFEKKIAAAETLRFPPVNASPDVIFSHANHLARGIPCEICHGNVSEMGEVDDRVLARMESCMDCHARERAPNACEDCHETLREGWPPPDHGPFFLREHGRAIRGRPGALESGRCDLCHGRGETPSCERCHLEVPPEDHTEFWRRFGHGVAAAVDRGRCYACHREDTCIRCHSEFPPMSHVGAFGGTFSGHCLQCHEPLPSNSCFVCHKATPSHGLAPPKPPPPHPGAGADCRACHFPGNMLPHADNGMDCNGCHF